MNKTRARVHAVPSVMLAGPDGFCYLLLLQVKIQQDDNNGQHF